MKNILIQLQLSNYDTKGNFILEADSGYQMMFGRIRELIKLIPDVVIDVIGPKRTNIITQPETINCDLFMTGQVRYHEIDIIPNALATRYDFNFEQISQMLLQLKKHYITKYDIVYINDPMLLRNYKALFHLKMGYKPKFIVHSHFIDNPECPKFPIEASLWLGQCEAAISADFNFWQCESSMNVFFDSMSKFFNKDIVDQVKAKSLPYDDGYSTTEMNSEINVNNIRFDTAHVQKLTNSKVVIFVPNRIGGMGRSSDYTNCGKFMFEILPQLRKIRDDFIVIAGNPSQKFSNNELEEIQDMCGDNGYVSLVEDAFNRDEYKYIARNIADIVVGLYNQDTYGGTASRECVDCGCWPLWLDCNEYSSLAREANYPDNLLCKPDFTNIVENLSSLISYIKYVDYNHKHDFGLRQLQKVIKNKCSYEMTTPKILKAIELL